jgi:hypothetical protein
MKRKELVSLLPVRIGSWLIQASIMDNDTICVMLYHKNGLRCFVRFFTDEEEANQFVSSIVYRRGQVIFNSDSTDA